LPCDILPEPIDGLERIVEMMWLKVFKKKA